MSNPIIAFYRGEGPDVKGRYLASIWEYSDSEIEESHDFIQWIFPLNETSRFNLHAPILDASTLIQLKKDPIVAQNIAKSLRVIIHFFGLKYDEGQQNILKSDAFPLKSRSWLYSESHHFLRITRILKSLRLLGLEDEARIFYDFLTQLYREYSDLIGEKAFRFWTESVMS